MTELSKPSALSTTVKAETVVVCPSSQMPAAAVVDHDNQIVSCSRRPLAASCSEDCSPQLRYTTDDLERFLRKAKEKKCIACDKPIGTEDWYASRLRENSTAIPRTNATVLRSEAPVLDRCYGCWAAVQR